MINSRRDVPIGRPHVVWHSTTRPAPGTRHPASGTLCTLYSTLSAASLSAQPARAPLSASPWPPLSRHVRPWTRFAEVRHVSCVPSAESWAVWYWCAVIIVIVASLESPAGRIHASVVTTDCGLRYIQEPLCTYNIYLDSHCSDTLFIITKWARLIERSPLRTRGFLASSLYSVCVY